MFLTLINVLIFIGLFAGGSFSTYALMYLVHFPHYGRLSLLGGFAAVLWLTWPIYRYFHFRPLCLPICPSCHDRPYAYGMAHSHWPRVILVCRNCAGPLEVWMTRSLDKKDASMEMPSFYLRWPEFIGLWRQVH